MARHSILLSAVKHQANKQALVAAFLPCESSSVRYGPRSFAVAGPSTWNALPAPLRNDELLCHIISSPAED